MTGSDVCLLSPHTIFVSIFPSTPYVRVLSFATLCEGQSRTTIYSYLDCLSEIACSIHSCLFWQQMMKSALSVIRCWPSYGGCHNISLRRGTYLFSTHPSPWLCRISPILLCKNLVNLYIVFRCHQPLTSSSRRHMFYNKDTICICL